MRETDAVLTARREMEICNACRYCLEGMQQHCLDMRFYGSAMPFPHVQGAFREELVCDAVQCAKVAGDVSYEELALCEPLSVVLHGARRAGPLLGKRVLVTGSGPIGALAVAVSRHFGAREVTVTDVVPEPLAIARGLGADRAVDVAWKAFATWGKTSPADIAATLAPLQSAVTLLQASQSSSSLTYDTLAQLNANLAPADGSSAQVINDGTNSGFYVKSGSANAGAWVKKSGATVPAVAGRLAPSSRPRPVARTYAAAAMIANAARPPITNAMPALIGPRPRAPAARPRRRAAARTAPIGGRPRHPRTWGARPPGATAPRGRTGGPVPRAPRARHRPPTSR